MIASRGLVLRLVLAVVLLAGVLPVGAAGPAGAAPVRDGKSQFTAAASCWEIKQAVPDAPSGVYWLVTPALVAPQQFACDMVTDGGGWVLVGRGREGWRREYEGVRPANVATTPDGTGAFLAAQLPSATIDGLLNNARVSSLSDGIRLRRALNTAGSSWQETRFALPNMGRWAWTFGGEHAVGSWRFGSTTGSGGLSRNFGADDAFNRVDWTARKEQNYSRGWSFGSTVKGDPSSSSYLWSATTSAGYAFPFTQMWIRPRLLTGDMQYTPVPDTGTDPVALRQIHSSRALPQTWGVSGLADPVDGELYVEVSDFTQIGNRVYVGGNFKNVQRGAAATGDDFVDQPYLAAFDVNTGEFDRGFRPVLNGRVKSLAALPDGTLVAGGHFTTANGAPASAIVGLDPATGATSTTWRPQIENRVIGGLPVVHSMDVYNGWLYLAGAFTHVSGTYVRNAARLNVTTAAADPAWNPAFDGTALGVKVSPLADRVYYAGYFTLSNGVPANKAALVSPDAGAALTPFTFVGSEANRVNYQFTAEENSGRFYFGGAEHSLFGYDRTTLQRKTGNIFKGGGDIQTSVSWRDIVYAGCHCDDWNYSDAYAWSTKTFSSIDRMGFVGAWDAASGKVLPDFNPVLRSRKGYGAWATFVDSADRLWIGGDYLSAVTASGANQWVGGFARFPTIDNTPPAAPSGLAGSPSASGAELTWAGSEAGAIYEVLQDDRVIATTTSTSITVPAAAGSSARYFVRARDAAGNRSASTPAVAVQGGGTGGSGGTVEAVVVSEGSQFAYRWDGAALDPAWIQPGFDDSSWARGTGPVGYGSTMVGTNVAAAGFPATRPLSIQTRATFDVANPSALTGASVTTYADDGVVVYVNGTEVGRSNLGTGTITQNAYATSAVRTTAARTVPVTFTVPAGLLRSGSNVLAVQASANFRTTPDMSVAVSMRTRASTTPAAVPSAPTGVSAAAGDGSASVTWVAPGSDGGSPVTGYTVTSSPGGRTCSASALSCTVSGLSNGTAYTFSVVARNAVGDSLPSAPSNSVTPVAATPVAVPSAPTGVSAVAGDGSASVTWVAPGSDGGSPVTGYTVTSSPGGRTCSASALSCTVSGLSNGTAYTFSVVARNAVGDSVPSAPSNSVTPVAATSPVLVASDGQFAYRWSTATLDPAWIQPGFDDSSWTRGAGPVGYGSTLVGTNLAAAGFPATRPLSIQGRASFLVADPAALGALTVTTFADDGVVVYVNGVEVGRSNMGTGTITQNSFATAAPRTATARGVPVTFTVPASLIRPGGNVLAVQASANFRSTPDMSFSVSLQQAR